MTEAEWLTCEDPWLMVEHLLGPRVRSLENDRKLRLFACALARSVWSVIGESNHQMIAWQEENPSTAPGREWHAGWSHPLRNSSYLQFSIERTFRIVGHPSFPDQGLALAAQVDILRDIVGNPFRSVTVDSIWFCWNEGKIQQIAQTAYDDRAFDLLPILADALEDSGCKDLAILDHCRGVAPHTRDCWLLDLILGKK